MWNPPDPADYLPEDDADRAPVATVNGVDDELPY
jgi:hypothetical protein